MEGHDLTDRSYDELEVGTRSGPYRETVTAELASRLAGSIGQPVAVTSAPPAVFPILFLRALRRSMGGIPSGAILAKQELEFHAVLPVGTVVQTTTWVSEKYVRRGRPYVVIEFDIRDPAGERIVTGRKVLVWPNGPQES